MAPTISTPANYSLLSLPAYLILTLVPHAYSTTLLHPAAATATNKKSDTPSKSSLYNMSNPRSSANTNTYSTTLPKGVYARYERARGAHNNMLENSAFFTSAILAGVVARVDPARMNLMAGLYLASRVGYLVSYIAVEKGPLSFLRTAWWVAGIGIIFHLWWVAGLRVMNGEY